MGQARSGKDTLAGYLIRNFGFERVGLADPLKRFCKEVFDFTNEQLWGDDRDRPDERYPRVEMCHGCQTCEFRCDHPISKTFLTPRYALQKLGTEWGRDCYGDIWIEYGVRVALTLLHGGFNYKERIGLVRTNPGDPPPTGVVFSDLRFRNEFDVIKKAGGFMVRVVRDGFDGEVGVSGHASEAEQKSIKDEEFDLILHNPPGLDNYYKAIDEAFTKVIRR